MSRDEPDGSAPLPELPEASPQPHGASPGGTEGADSAWTGGQSNLGDMLNPQPEFDTTYSTQQVGSAGRKETVRAFVCDGCNRTFASADELLGHQKESH